MITVFPNKIDIEESILDQSTAAFHTIPKGLFDFVIPQGEDERVQERGYHRNKQGNYLVVLSSLCLLRFHIEEQATAIADHNKGEVRSTRREGSPPARGCGDLEDGRDDVGVGDDCRDHRTNNNEYSHLKKNKLCEMAVITG